MEINREYLTSGKQQVLQVFLDVLRGGIKGCSFAALLQSSQMDKGALIKLLHNLAAAGYVVKHTSNWAVSPDFIEQFSPVIQSLGLEVK